MAVLKSAKAQPVSPRGDAQRLSGTGYYHGKSGFDTFSHLRAVAQAPRHFSCTSLISPPVPPKMEAYTRMFLRWQQHRFNKRLRRSDRDAGLVS